MAYSLTGSELGLAATGGAIPDGRGDGGYELPGVSTVSSMVAEGFHDASWK